ncbi:MAG: hypothetical protein KBT47_01710, partial [Armatimonadetes bacterium]|nr:hypothetical protein [Candidatus Hippobium faecium]
KMFDRYEQYLKGANALYSSVTAKGSKAVQVDLNKDWLFVKDVNDKGVLQKWFADYTKFADGDTMVATKGWEVQAEGKYEGYDGCGWYYKHIKVPQDILGMNRVYFYSGGADEQLWLYINDQPVGERTAKSTGKTPSEFWNHPLYIDITKYVKEDMELVIRMYDDNSQGGLFGGAYIFGTYDVF